MIVDVAFSFLDFTCRNVKDDAVVVIDVIRGTTTLVTAFENGCAFMVPTLSPDDARELARGCPRSRVLLVGERGGQKIEGFDLGNSPREYDRKTVKDKILIWTTTNCTKLLVAAGSVATEVLTCSFLNISSICNHILRLNKNLLIACAGNEGSFDLEDVVCGGMLIDLIEQNSKIAILKTDSARAAEILFAHYESNISDMLDGVECGKILHGIGLAKDLCLCGAIDSSHLVPLLYQGKIVLDSKRRCEG